ncbi:MAG: hypothetical protein JOS17DRAFT_819742 [Linnemannia elongata]|nr:MAG: hypothetical protein JOS17DRAFT_819742 [Linnemannia elongata]
MDRLSRLPPEILVQIGRSLPNQEFVRLLQTNQEIRQVLNTRWMRHLRFMDRIGLGSLRYQVLYKAELQRIASERRSWEKELQEKMDGDGEKLEKLEKANVKDEKEEEDDGVELRVDMAEMSTMIREGEHRGKYYWATLYGVQPGQRYWVQWGISIKDRFGSYESDYRVWISDKHKAEYERNLHSLKPTTPTRLEDKNNNINSTDVNNNNSKHNDNHISLRTPSAHERVILQLPYHSLSLLTATAKAEAESNYSSSLSPPPSTSKHIKTMTLFKISTKKNNNKTHSASSSTTTSPILSPRSSVQEPRPDDFCTMTIEQALDQAFFLDQFVGSNHSSYQAPPVIKF